MFNQLLTALDNMVADNLDRPAVMSDMEYDEFYQLYSGLFLEDSLLSSVSTGREYLLGPLALNNELDYKVGAYMQVMFVNPNCANMPEALKLLECYVQNISPYSLIPLSPNANDPLPNPDYEQTVQNLQENLAEDVYKRQASGNISPPYSLGCLWNPFLSGKRHVAGFFFDVPAQSGGQAAPYGRGTKAPQSRPQQGFPCREQPVPRAGAQLCRKKVKPCRNFHPWNVN